MRRSTRRFAICRKSSPVTRSSRHDRRSNINASYHRSTWIITNGKSSSNGFAASRCRSMLIAEKNACEFFKLDVLWRFLNIHSIILHLFFAFFLSRSLILSCLHPLLVCECVCVCVSISYIFLRSKIHLLDMKVK